jgi:hypothetical protein
MALPTFVRAVLTGVAMQGRPPDSYLPEYDVEEEDNPDMRLGKYAKDHLVVRPDFYDDGETYD